MPVLAILWATHGMLFRDRWSLLSLPSTFWYALGLVTAALSLLVDYLAGCQPPRD
jgi:hypothetical protein